MDNFIQKVLEICVINFVVLSACFLIIPYRLNSKDFLVILAESYVQLVQGAKRKGAIVTPP